ncbi:hypothetical protein CFK40_14165 [Virgibacillus necropolis]|uniref:YwqI/YxiC family protein n=2 Tax=Virgibacillus necropolis TaxID=163877 RepID=A0A221MIC5_9BACI|nr:hypothetical protein CFK40_14165 [Virgibacillus necropolis]
MKSSSGGTAEIRLDYAAVMSELDKVKQALEALQLAQTSEGLYGQNNLNYTDQWLDRENRLHATFQQYIQIVQKNIEDTKANVTMLKNQDEAINRK